MSTRDFDTLIVNLTQGLCPVRCLTHPFRRFAVWAALTLVYEALVVTIIGLRPDISFRLADFHFLFETGLIFAVCLSAAAASAWLCVPDMRGRRWLVALPLSWIAVFFFWLLLRLAAGAGDAAVQPLSHDRAHCLAASALVLLAPMAVLAFMTRRGATTCPVRSSLMNTLAVGGAGYIALRLICETEGAAHDLAYHVVPFMVLGGVTGLFARRIYHW